MAYRFVRAQPRTDRLPELRERLEGGDIRAMDPFGEAMTASLLDARLDPETGEAVWVEEDYCSPPLAMERAVVLDDYFEDVAVVHDDVDPEEGWARIDALPPLWDHVGREA